MGYTVWWFTNRGREAHSLTVPTRERAEQVRTKALDEGARCAIYFDGDGVLQLIEGERDGIDLSSTLARGRWDTPLAPLRCPRCGQVTTADALNTQGHCYGCKLSA